MLISALTLAGCRVDVEQPEPASINELRQDTLGFLDALDAAVAEGSVPVDKVRALGTRLTFLRGHMRTVGVGTEEQLRALDEILIALGQQANAMRPPADWRPPKDDETPPPPLIEPGPLRDLLPQIRRVVESIPDSDARPEFEAD